MHRTLLLFLLIAFGLSRSNVTLAQQADTSIVIPKAPAKPWYDRFSIRGYAQLRYNRLLETNPGLQCDQCDKSWGEDGGFFIRRARIIFSGFIHPRVFMYIQPDFASTAGSTNNIAQLRDCYMDLGLDPKNEFRIRLGQSKIPYSFENMQSSQNRLPLDRADPTNSAHSNERDLGAFFYWAPEKIRERYSMLVRDGYKGSGDYGVFALGAFNGQTANRDEQNNELHVVGRISCPLQLGNQIIEPGVAAYSGNYVLPASLRSPGMKGSDGFSYADRRVLGSLVLYSKPVGVLAEYNIGEGPEYNTVTDSVETRSLQGGFVTVNYMFRKLDRFIIPFVRYQFYEGGKKHELDARSYRVNDFEVGVEWQPHRNFELVVEYYFGDRRFEDGVLPSNKQVGQLLRVQAQLNF